MNILVTGQLGPVSYSFTDKLSAHGYVIASSEDLNPNYIGNIHRAYTHRIGDDEFARLFSVHSLDAVVYFLDLPNMQHPDFCAIDKLDTVLSLCAKHNVTKFIIISSTYIGDEDFSPEQHALLRAEDPLKVLLISCESLCQAYHRNKGLEIVMLRAPHLFGRGENQSLMGKCILQAVSKQHVRIDGQRKQLINLLSLEDLGELVSRILFDYPEEFMVMDLPGSATYSLLELGELFRSIIPTARITFSDIPIAAGRYSTSTVARTAFEWVPVVQITDEIPIMAESICQDAAYKKPTLRQRISAAIQSRWLIWVAVELALGYLAMEYLNHLANTAVQFKFVDFRLLYVAMFAAVHGLKAGMAASVLACISSMAAFMAGGNDIRLVLFNIDNWLPFACYIMLGTVIGYTRDKRENQLRFVTEEKNTLEKRYMFLLELYDNALYNRDLYKRQIMSYRNSFGRIFDVTRRLNSLMPDAVFKEALLALEDILDNQSITIYNLSGHTEYARLCVCSKKIIDTAPRSIHMDIFAKAISELQPGEVWTNMERWQDHPDYLFPVYRDNTLVSLILIDKVPFEQMTMYYENLIKIFCNLIQDSLVRALDYVTKLSNEIYIGNSTVMNKSAFRKLIEIREKMEQEAISEYSILKVDANERNIEEIFHKIKGYFRSNDIFGQGEDGNLYIVLTGTGKEAMKSVISRLEDQGIMINVM